MPRRKLGVNIDHVATVRQARRTTYPDPVTAAALAEQAGADQITVHLREDRRHIQDRDVHVLRQTVQTLLNLEMAATDEMVKIALNVKPHIVTLVPEKRQEVTTEGGLDVCGNEAVLRDMVARLRDGGIEVSMFIDPDLDQVRASQRLHADTVELHTGCYCEAPLSKRQPEHKRLADAARFAAQQNMRVAAGHGIHYHNVAELIRIEDIVEYNIGHSIVAQAVMVGFDRAVRDMLAALTL